MDESSWQSLNPADTGVGRRRRSVRLSSWRRRSGPKFKQSEDRESEALKRGGRFRGWRRGGQAPLATAAFGFFGVVLVWWKPDPLVGAIGLLSLSATLV